MPKDSRSRSPKKRSPSPRRDSRSRGGQASRRDSRPRGRQSSRRDSRSRPRSNRRDRRSPPRRRSPRGGGDEIMTLWVKDLPSDYDDDAIQDDLMDGFDAKVLRAIIMRQGARCSAFVRFETRADAERALDDIKDGQVKICGSRNIGGEMARSNTKV
eukprot:gnl/MRDRNA2_/MRDRNA2_140694_c0_seq1.p1 gnl/MRDRNA2_/MRDRNA2_140694_c0~~gnl/MRDRNA2_/MRDRNA2_140694_c0_seq1.p1  ORF type:complete len:157 (+),score=15.01 gnl/MRDRNA2_/MRDRNA2_140694_c0_seq1:109-579(+)